MVRLNFQMPLLDKETSYMYDELYDAIMKVDFKKAERIFLEFSTEIQKEVIEKLVYRTESMIIYLFIQYINQRQEKITFHEIQFDMLTNALCHIEGAYQMALFHNQRLLEMNPESVRYMEWMLSLYDVKVIDNEKALDIVNKLLKYDDKNFIGNMMIKRIN